MHHLKPMDGVSTQSRSNSRVTGVKCCAAAVMTIRPTWPLPHFEKGTHSLCTTEIAGNPHIQRERERARDAKISTKRESKENHKHNSLRYTVYKLACLCKNENNSVLILSAEQSIVPMSCFVGFGWLHSDQDGQETSHCLPLWHHSAKLRRNMYIIKEPTQTRTYRLSMVQHKLRF